MEWPHKAITSTGSRESRQQAQWVPQQMLLSSVRPAIWFPSSFSGDTCDINAKIRAQARPEKRQSDQKKRKAHCPSMPWACTQKGCVESRLAGLAAQESLGLDGFLHVDPEQSTEMVGSAARLAASSSSASEKQTKRNVAYLNAYKCLLKF